MSNSETGGDSATRRWPTAAVLMAWCLLTLGDSAHAGYWTGAGLTSIGVGFAILVVVVASKAVLTIPTRAVLGLPVLACVERAIVDPTMPYLYQHGGDLHAIEALRVVTVVALAIMLLLGDRFRGPAWWTFVALVAATGITTIVLISNPNIDVWDLLQQSSSGLLHGDDMYRQHWMHSTGLQTVYPYLPGSTLLVAPFRWLFGDVRYGLLAASVLAAGLIRRFAPTTSQVVPALLLVAPGWVLLINRSWTEPLLIAALVGAMLAMDRDRPWLATIGLAVALASKQHIVLLLPLFVAWPAFGLRRTATSGGLAALVVLPWVIAGPHDFWHDAVHANLALGVQTSALNLPSLFLRHNVTVGFWFVAVSLLAAYGLAIWRLPRTPSGLALGCALVMWTFDLTNKQTYFNHYWLPLGLLVLAVALASERSEPAAT